ncbi:MAG: T9SS type A sorting domain-containing protein [Flavobacteriaceae bacterium]
MDDLAFSGRLFYIDKMVKYIYIIALLFINLKGIAQFGPQRIITTEAHLPVRAVAGDINGDGHIDVVLASRSLATPYNLAWLENTNGLGDFGSINLIGTMSETYRINLADLDGDGDLDAMGATVFLDIISWFENLDGLGNFGPRNIISNTADGAHDVIAADLDNDGDMDVISASNNSGLTWYENLDGQGNFSASKIINNIIDSSRSVVAVDMDGDGDIDILGNARQPAQIFWMENMDGQGTFGTMHIVLEMGFYANTLLAADVDGDNDMDIFSATPYTNEVAWYENLDGLGNFGSKNIITNTLSKPFAVYVADLDNDGDNDVLATSVDPFGGEVVWFENLDGLGSFSTKNSIDSNLVFPRDIYAADIDNDGDMDVLIADQKSDTIAWYENKTIIGIEENQLNNLNIYPNPTKGLVFISSKTETIIGITVFDVLGKKVLQLEGNIQQVDISSLQSGMYFLRIVTDRGEFVQKIIKE